MEHSIRENPFDAHADRYDQWFESPRGRAIFALEAAALRELLGPKKGRWLEVGVGSGRFAVALGVEEGVDPSPAALAYAARRGVRTRLGRAEALPWPEAVFDGALMVVTICFVEDPSKALAECRRVLRPGGRLLTGLVPADSPWGRLYAQKARQGHLFYTPAKFYTCEQVARLAEAEGLAFRDARSALLAPPEAPEIDPSLRAGVVPGAGFVAMEFVKPGEGG